MTTFKEYETYDGLGLAQLIRTKQVSQTEVLTAAIERVDRHNDTLNAVVHKMYETARQAIREGLPAGPFTGVPYLLKDLYLAYAGAPLTNGSRIFADFVPDYDSTLVERYRAAGLVILGKTNTPEFGLCAATEPALHGPTLNPWNPDRSPGGSSGGAAAAVAARMLPMAHATDGGGSIRIPAANCGLFGLKPTRARVPMGPNVGEAFSGMSVGHCVSRTVRDSAALLDATRGPASGDPYWAPPPARPFLEEVGADSGRLRIAFTTKTFDGTPLHPECVRAIEVAAGLCADLGHEVEEATPVVDNRATWRLWRTLAGVHIWNMLALRATALGRKPRPEDVEPVTWTWGQEGRECTGTRFLSAIQTMHRIGRKLADFFERYDLLLSTTMADPPVRLGVVDMSNPDLDDYCERHLVALAPFTPIFNEAGAPAMSIPLHWTDDGLPVGVHFGARFGDEATLFRMAAQLEEARPWAERRPPILI
uniref:Amidase n=1 Tax=Candidatus Kentrum eta TaxID=2126337 RepID=A0A450U762_9GAMM|nr:MAG: amidase [Candidatus Kentron sp. H]VFJ89330.1 MAG: amidase [Candidatus Kentron sp. H]VFJ95905.1 MAG: amidase [Candidatus Kentron sp. H]